MALAAGAAALAGPRLIAYREDVRAIAASATHAFAATGAGELAAIDLHTAERRVLAGPNARGPVAWVTASGGHVLARRNIGGIEQAGFHGLLAH